MPAALQVISHCCARYRLLYDRPVFVVRITAARRYAASRVDFKAFVQGTRIFCAGHTDQGSFAPEASRLTLP
jgi:hypothetical protein